MEGDAGGRGRAGRDRVQRGDLGVRAGGRRDSTRDQFGISRVLCETVVARPAGRCLAPLFLLVFPIPRRIICFLNVF